MDESPLQVPYELTPEQIQTYHSKGHVLLRGVCPPEVLAPYHEAIRQAALDKSKDAKPLAERDTYGKAFLQVMNLWRQSEKVREFVMARRFAQIAAELMGVAGARLYHDQALFKEPGGGHTPWHQDQQYWPLEGAQTITMWMPLVDLTPEMGQMRFADGSQREGYLGAMPIGDDSEVHFKKFLTEKGYKESTPIPMKAGDATFHSGWTLHAAPGNPSNTLREVMTIIYYEDGVKVSQPDNPNQEADLAAWFPGLQPGDLAASEINPRLYP